MKHTVASVGLISTRYLIADNVPLRHCTCDIPNVYINYHNRFKPRADNFFTTNVCDFVLLAKLAKLIVRKHF